METEVKKTSSRDDFLSASNKRLRIVVHPSRVPYQRLFETVLAYYRQHTLGWLRHRRQQPAKKRTTRLGRLTKQMPPEILHRFFSFMDEKTLASASVACTEWYAIAQCHEEELWEALCISKWGVSSREIKESQISPKSMFQALEARWNSIKNASLGFPGGLFLSSLRLG